MTSGHATTGSAGLSLAVFSPDGRLEARYPLNRMNIGSGEADTIAVEGVGAAYASVVRTVGEGYKVKVNAAGATLSSEETGIKLSELTLTEGVKFRIGGVLISCDRETSSVFGADDLSDICPFCLTPMADRAATTCHGCGRSLQWLRDSRWSGWTPTALGDYRIRRVVGSGGMGVVLLGIDGDDRLAAVKVIRSKFPNPTALRRFDAEVAIIRDMPPHPNIVGYKGHGIEAQRLRWLAMEWVEGMTLADHLALEPQHKLSIGQVSLIMGQLIQGLRHLHNNGIAHRDLKPANIFLRPDQGVKIVDFGIARAPDAGAGLTTTGHLAGTKNYASPEQNRGGEAGPASDLYSLGLVWQEMLTGANTGGALRIKRDDCPSAWREIIGDMLELEPSSRPTSETIEAALRTMKGPAPSPKPVVSPEMKERIKQLEILAKSGWAWASHRLYGVQHWLKVLKLRLEAALRKKIDPASPPKPVGSAEMNERIKQLKILAKSGWRWTAQRLCDAQHWLKALLLQLEAYRRADDSARAMSANTTKPAHALTSPLVNVLLFLQELRFSYKPVILATAAFLVVVLLGILVLAVALSGSTKSTNHRPGLEREFEIAPSVTMKMCWIPPGVFVMGKPVDELGRLNDETQHRVTLTQGFWLGKYEVTQAQWEAVMGSNPSSFKGTSLPVESVSRNDISGSGGFLERINHHGATRGLFHLPTEAQWEYACRAGTTTALNNGMNLSCRLDGCPNLDEVAWYCVNSGSKTHSVSLKKPNAWGLHDMHGNVREWCADWYEDYPDCAVTDPIGSTPDLNCVMRGGSWDSDSLCASGSRYGSTPELRNNCFGFRILLAPDQSEQ